LAGKVFDLVTPRSRPAAIIETVKGRKYPHMLRAPMTVAQLIEQLEAFARRRERHPIKVLTAAERKAWRAFCKSPGSAAAFNRWEKASARLVAARRARSRPGFSPPRSNVASCVEGLQPREGAF
jgi:hypothetical protein